MSKILNDYLYLGETYVKENYSRQKVLDLMDDLISVQISLLAKSAYALGISFSNSGSLGKSKDHSIELKLVKQWVYILY